MISLNYIKYEFKRSFDTKIICIGIIIIGFFSFVFGKFILSESISIFLKMLSNVNLIYLIACSSSLATEDFEYGTYKNIYTGRYSFISIILMKLIVYMLIGLTLSLVFGIILLSNVIVLGESINLNILKEALLETIIIYLSCTVCMFSFSQFVGLIFKNFSLNLIIMFSFFYGIFSELINLFFMSPKGFISKMLSFLPFSIVPKMIINWELSYFNVVVLILSAIMILLLIKIFHKMWFSI